MCMRRLLFLLTCSVLIRDAQQTSNSSASTTEAADTTTSAPAATTTTAAAAVTTTSAQVNATTGAAAAVTTAAPTTTATSVVATTSAQVTNTTGAAAAVTTAAPTTTAVSAAITTAAPGAATTTVAAAAITTTAQAVPSSKAPAAAALAATTTVAATASTATVVILANVTGTWTIVVDDLASFESSAGVRLSIQQSLAAMAGYGVTPSQVSFVYQNASGGRRLTAADVNVAYSINSGSQAAAANQQKKLSDTDTTTSYNTLLKNLQLNNAQADAGSFESKGLTATIDSSVTPSNHVLAVGLGVGLGVGLPVALGLGLGLGLGLPSAPAPSLAAHFSGGWVWPSNGTGAVDPASNSTQQILTGVERAFSQLTLPSAAQEPHSYVGYAVLCCGLLLLALAIRSVRSQLSPAEHQPALLPSDEDVENNLE